MLRFSRPKKPADPLRERFGLKREGLRPGVRAAFDALLDENADLRRRLAEAESLADHDTLTSALNRRAFMRALHGAMSYAERYKTPAAVLYIDLDGFKAINDNFGHAAGDAVLKHIANLLRAQVRESDTVGRIGGDEFALILVHASLEEAKKKAASLEEAIRANPATFAGVTHRIAASVGVHGLTLVEDPEHALARADEAMYAAKHARKRALEER
ncbi:MAG: GGDEF domain-containing protein [Hyphomonadaceae bacterium]